MSKQNVLKGLFRIKNEVAYLYSLFKISLFRACVKEAVVFVSLVM